jgi:hypothetical protein
VTWWKTKRADADPPRERLLEVAKSVATERGWPWLEPVEVDLESSMEGKRVWAVRTNCYVRGQNVKVVVSEPDFAVVSAGFLPR